MPWYFYVARFFAGAFFANAVPHFVNGVSGRPFPSPFASPPGRGPSTPLVNVLWAAVNVAIGFLLLHRPRGVSEQRFKNALTVAAGALVMSIMLAVTFGNRMMGR